MVPYDGDTVHTSLVVMAIMELTFVVKGPNGEQVHDERDKSEVKNELVAYRQGLCKFFFYDKSPYHENIDFDVHVGHIP